MIVLMILRNMRQLKFLMMNIEIDQVFYEKVEVKILEHARYLSNINSFGRY
jgi:hypothetical protein